MLMQSLKLLPALLCPPLSHLPSNYARSFVSPFFIGSFSTQVHDSKERDYIIDYLNANFKFSKAHSIYISKRVSGLRFPKRPLSVLKFFRQNGFSEAQIQSMIRQTPSILFFDVDKTLRPKIELFQQLGFEGSELCKFLSKNSTILSSSLKKSLVPSVEAVRKILYNEKDFIKVLHRCGGWILPKYQKFANNVNLLESCGIVGSQLSMLLRLQPRLFVSAQSTVRNHVLQAVKMGFHENSRMFVHVLQTMSCLNKKTVWSKLEVIQSFGFSKDESLQMFKRAPALLRTSEEKLKIGMEFFLHTVMLPKSDLVQQSVILMFSMEDRVFPRYRVFQLLISKNLCKKLPKFINVLFVSQAMFLDRYILRFRENVDELMVAYRGHCLET